MTQDEATVFVSSLFSSWYPSLVRYAYSLSGSVALSEDVVQESFMQLYRELGAGKTVRNPRGWTLCVVRREIGKQRTHISREMSLNEAVHGSVTVSRAYEPALALEHEEMARTLDRLSPREKQVMLLRLESLKCREIALELGISINSVTTLLARALRKLSLLMNHRASLNCG